MAVISIPAQKTEICDCEKYAEERRQSRKSLQELGIVSLVNELRRRVERLEKHLKLEKT